jgi:hypothetical protein
MGLLNMGKDHQFPTHNVAKKKTKKKVAVQK